MQTIKYLIESLWLRLIFSYLLGAFLFFTLPPFNIIFLSLISFSGFLFLLLKAPSKKQAAIMGFLFGMGYFMVGLYWINNALLLDSTFYWLTLPTIFLLPAYLSIYISIPALLTWAVRSYNIYLTYFTWAATLTIGEVLRGVFLSGFPWNPFGLIFSSSLELLQSASVFGVYGLSFFLILFSSSLLLLFSHPKHIKFFTFIVGLFLCIWGYGYYRTTKNPTKTTPNSLALVQPNIPQHPFFSNEQKRKNLRKIVNLTLPLKASKPNIIVWPESAVPFAFNHIPSLETYLKNILSPQSLLIFGTMRLDRDHPKARIFNTLYVLSRENGIEGFYDKNHLLPFGEYVPFSDLVEKFFPIKAMTGGGMNFSSGKEIKEFFLPFSLPGFIPSICYEAIFPKYYTNAKVCPRWIINITNDAWFGQSTGPYQHFQMSRLRAIETGLPVVRVATTGISGVIDSYGRILSTCALNKKCIISTYLPKSIESPTLFSIYGHWLIFFFLITIWLLLFSIYRMKKK